MDEGQMSHIEEQEIHFNPLQNEYFHLFNRRKYATDTTLIHIPQQ